MRYNMRRLGIVGCSLSKVLGGCLSAKGLMRPEGVELVGEGVEPSVGVLEVVGVELPAGVELVAPSPVVALDMSVGLGRSGRQLEELDVAPLTLALEGGLELGAAIELDGGDGEGHVGLQLVEEALGVVSRGAPVGSGTGPLGHRIAGGELFDGGAPGTGREGESIDLDDLAGPRGSAALGQSPGMGRLRRAAPGARRLRMGTGRTWPRTTSIFRMRPTVLSLTVYPWRRRMTASLASPHMG